MKSLSERVILHSDMNCFYASVEMLHHPEFAGRPLAVGGDPEARHGIVLTANYIAKETRCKNRNGIMAGKTDL
ncbi:Nucleotidyltransferase/DNA polymerase involved in DNA repair, partial [human gut metagenome]